MPRLDELLQGSLVAVVGDGPQERDGHRGHALGNQPVHDGRRLVEVQLHHHRALVVDTLLHLPYQPPRHQRVGFGQGEKVGGLRLGEPFGHPPSHHVDAVGEALGSDEPGPGSRAGEQRIVPHRAAVEEQLGGVQQILFAGHAQMLRGIAYRVEDALGKVVRRGQRLADRQLRRLRPPPRSR